MQSNFWCSTNAGRLMESSYRNLSNYSCWRLLLHGGDSPAMLAAVGVWDLSDCACAVPHICSS